jgi:hypothetical protein
MPQPNVQNVHIDAILTNISVAYLQNTDNFIADKVFPVIPVDKKSNLYFKYTKDDWFRDEAQRRADGTVSAGSGYGLTTDTYMADVWAFHKDIGDQTRANADNPLNPDMEATQFITQRLLLRREVQWASDYFQAGVWALGVTGQPATGSTATVAAGTAVWQWDDYVGATGTSSYTNGGTYYSNPIADVELAKAAILQTTGYEPNTLVLGYRVFQVLKNHPLLVDRYKFTQAGAIVTEDLLAQLFGVDRVLVAKAVVNTANETAGDLIGVGVNSSNYKFTVGNNALLAYTAPNPGLMTPSAGYTFMWTGVSGGLGTTVGVSRFRMEELKADRVEGEIAFDNKVVAADLGYFFSNIIGGTAI